MIINPDQLIDRVKEDYEKGEFVVFIGAGISRLMGCMGWEQLAKELIFGAFQPIAREQVLGAVKNSKELITIAYRQFDHDKNLKGFYKIFDKAFKVNKRAKNIYEIIRELNCRFVTTNCDGLLEKVLSERNYSLECTIESFKKSKAPHVFYLHGRYVDKNKSDKISLVFTANDYVKKYSNPDFLNFLDMLLNENTVLFLGYGLNEFELLDHLFTKKGIRGAKRHYILEGFYSHLPALQSAKENYYDSLGIDLVPYNMDEKEHSEQITVINNLVSKISEKTSKNAVIYENIINLMSTYSDGNFNEIMIFLKSNDGDNPFVNEFFSSIVKRTDYLLWLTACYKQGLFMPKKCPPVDIPKEGTLRGVRWVPLYTLNRCLQKNRNDAELIELAANIVAPIIEWIADRSPLKDNFTLMNDLLDIVLNLTNSHIIPQMISFIKGTSFALVHMDQDILVNSNYLKWEKQKLHEVLNCFLGYKTVTKPYYRTEENLHQYQLEYFLEKDDYSGEQSEVLFDVALEILFSLKRDYGLSRIRFIENILENSTDSYYGFLISLVNKYFHMKTNKNEIVLSLLSDPEDTFIINLGFYMMRTHHLSKQILFNLSFNPLDNTGVFTELYALLGYYKHGLTKSEIDCLLQWVHDCNMDVREDWEYRDTFVNTQKANFYHLLSDVSQKSKKLYDEYKTYDVWEIKNPIKESKMYDIGGRITPKPIFTSEEIPIDIVMAISFIKENFDSNHFHTPETVFEIIKYLKDGFQNNTQIISQILLEQSDAVLMEVISALRQVDENSPAWKSSVHDLYEELVNRQLFQRDIPNEDLIKCIIQAIKYDDKLNIFDDKNLALCGKLIDNESKYNNSNNQLKFPNYWNNIMIQIFDFYIHCLMKISSTINDANSRISEENMAMFIALLERNRSQSFQYVISERIDEIIYLNKELVISNLDNILKFKGIMNLGACLSIMNKSRYIYSEITHYFITNNIFSELLKSGILDDEDVKRYNYERGLCRYLIASYSFNNYDFDILREFIDLCPSSYYVDLIQGTTSKKGSDKSIDYEKIFIEVIDAIFDKAKGNNEILYDVCSSALDIYKVVDEPSDALFAKAEFCLNSINEKETYWHQLGAFIEKYQPKYLEKMIGCIKIFLHKTNYIYLDKIEKIADGLVAISKIDDAKEIYIICINRGFHVKELSKMLVDLKSTSLYG